MKNLIFLLILIHPWLGNSQTNELHHKKDLNFPTERIYIHTNTQNVFVGETFLYKIYVTTAENHLLSNISKVAYVYLIGKKNTLVFKQKIKLSNGQGYGDFLMPSEIPTGNYKLIAYTKMGLNQPDNNAFITDVAIINPYIPIDPDLVSVVDKVPENRSTPHKSNLESKIKIRLKDSIFKKREKIELKLLVNDESDYGNYSISVKKLDSLNFRRSPTILKHGETQKTIKVDSTLDLLPELRGELVTGRIISSDENAPLKYQSLALSIPGNDFILKMGTTDEHGRFYFNIDKMYSSDKAFLQVLNKFSESYRFEVDEGFILDIPSFSFEKLTLYNGLKEQIINRSIKNQIENSYSSVKLNIPKPKELSPFFGDRGIRYNLDDFTRFPTLSETFVEIINSVSFRKKDSGYEIIVRAINDFLRSPFEAMVLIDGILIQDHSKLYNFNAKEIQYITVIRDKYLYGGKAFQGVVSIETKGKEYQNQINSSSVKSIELFCPEQEKIYYKVNYDKNKNLKHIPDFRTQLFWDPNLKIISPQTALNFFSSDNNGVYEIILEGISDKGEKIRTTAYFKVF